MARTRQLSPLFWEDADLAACSERARLLFLGLLNLADREGRLHDVPPWIRAKLFPYEELDAEEYLAELAAGRRFSPSSFITRYEANGKRFIQINNFRKYQKPHPREAESEIPPPHQPRRDPGNTKDRPGHEEALSSQSFPSFPSFPSTPSNPSADLGGAEDVPAPAEDLDDSGLTVEDLERDPPRVYWDSALHAVSIDEDWIRSEIEDFQSEAGVALTRGEYRDEVEQLKLKLLEDPRLRACIRKADGKPSSPAQFKRLASYTSGWFKRAIRRKADREKRATRGSPKSTAARSAKTDDAFKTAMERALRKEASSGKRG